MLKWSCKKIFAGIAIISLAGNIFPVMPTVSGENLPSYYERTPSEREKALLSARDFAYQYLKNSSEEPFWKNKFPYISGEKFFYTANDDIPSYIEFKISTSESNDAGFIIVNLDGNDVQVPIASPSGKTPSEALNIRFDKNHGNSENEKLYYFSPFDQWIVDENGNAETLNPNNQEDKIIETEKSENNFENNSEISLRSAENRNNENVAKILTEEWKQKQNEKFAEMRRDAKNFVETNEFKNKTATLKSESRSVYQYLWGTSDVLLPWYRNSGTCPWSVPCYNQFSRKYGWFWWSYCKSGCVPSAIASIMGYLDMHWYPNLIQWMQAPIERNSTINKLIIELGDAMHTQCSNGWWITYESNFHNSRYILNRNGYNFTTFFGAGQSPYEIHKTAKEEINNWRPLMLWIYFQDDKLEDHAAVIFWYSSQHPQLVRVNLQFWSTHKDWNFATSNIDLNLSSIKYMSHTAHINGRGTSLFFIRP